MPHDGGYSRSASFTTHSVKGKHHHGGSRVDSADQLSDLPIDFLIDFGDCRPDVAIAGKEIFLK